MLIALASCTAVSVVGILEKKRTPLSALEIEARGEQDPNPPWTFRRVDLHFKLQGSGLTERAVEHAIQVAEEKYCSIAANLHATAEISTSFEILPDQQSEEWQALGTSLGQ
jgi:putative redox protein